MTHSVEFTNVSVSYPSQKIPTFKEWLVRRRKQSPVPIFHALRDVSLTIEQGEAFGVIGRNGAGKSTLLRVAAGIVPPTQGAVTTRGTVAPLIELGTGFDGELSGRENVFFNGALLGRSHAYMESRIAEIIDFAELGDFIDVPLRTYSTGMVARLAFAIATTIDASLVLLDEILAVGDATFQEKCDLRIRSFHEAGSTILLVSHDLVSIRRLCQRAAWIHAGRVMTIGPTADVIEAYERSIHELSPVATEQPPILV
jgi:ABC-2 type transport system ATP-binding protein